MFHPHAGDLSDLKDSEIEEKVLELTQKYFAARRLGKQELLTQISTFLTIYKNELSDRMRKKLSTEVDGDLDQLINVNN